MPAIGDGLDVASFNSFLAHFASENARGTLRGYGRAVRAILSDGKPFGLQRGLALDAPQVEEGVWRSELNRSATSGGVYLAGLRKFVQFIKNPHPATRSSPVAAGGVGEYEVDAITDRQIRADGTVWYEVQWRTYDEPSWEPARALGNALDEIAALERRRESSGRPLTPLESITYLPTGTETPKLHATVRVQYETGIFEGTVIKRHRDGSFDVEFPSDGNVEVQTMEPGKHQYEQVPPAVSTANYNINAISPGNL